MANLSNITSASTDLTKTPLFTWKLTLYLIYVIFFSSYTLSFCKSALSSSMVKAKWSVSSLPNTSSCTLLADIYLPSSISASFDSLSKVCFNNSRLWTNEVLPLLLMPVSIVSGLNSKFSSSKMDLNLFTDNFMLQIYSFSLNYILFRPFFLHFFHYFVQFPSHSPSLVRQKTFPCPHRFPYRGFTLLDSSPAVFSLSQIPPASFHLQASLNCLPYSFTNTTLSVAVTHNV